MFFTVIFVFFLMIRLPPRSTRTTHSFPTRRSSDLRGADEAVAACEAGCVIFVVEQVRGVEGEAPVVPADLGQRVDRRARRRDDRPDIARRDALAAVADAGAEAPLRFVRKPAGFGRPERSRVSRHLAEDGVDWSSDEVGKRE